MGLPCCSACCVRVALRARRRKDDMVPSACRVRALFWAILYLCTLCVFAMDPAPPGAQCVATGAAIALSAFALWLQAALPKKTEKDILKLERVLDDECEIDSVQDLHDIETTNNWDLLERAGVKPGSLSKIQIALRSPTKKPKTSHDDESSIGMSVDSSLHTAGLLQHGISMLVLVSKMHGFTCRNDIKPMRF